MAGSEAQQARGARVAREERGIGAWGAWQILAVHAGEAKTLAGTWRRVL